MSKSPAPCYIPRQNCMETSQTNRQLATAAPRNGSRLDVMLSSVIAAVLAVMSFHLSLVATSARLAPHEEQTVESAIAVLDARGFKTEVFFLRHFATYRSTDNWF